MAPVVTAVNCTGSPLVDATSVNFSVSFNKAVTNAATSDFAVTGDAGGAVTAVTVSGNTCLVTVSGITGSGSLGLTVLAGGTITDLLGTPLVVPPAIPEQAYTICTDLYYCVPSTDAAGISCTWGAGCNVLGRGGPQRTAARVGR